MRGEIDDAIVCEGERWPGGAEPAFDCEALAGGRLPSNSGCSVVDELYALGSWRFGRGGGRRRMGRGVLREWWGWCFVRGRWRFWGGFG